MTTEMSWMVKDIVDNVPGARHAVVLSADGLPRGATDRLTEKDVKTISAAMSGMQSLSRATAHFAGAAPEQQWNQTVIEFSHGWVFLIGAGQGAYLAAAAEPDVDLQQLSFRMNRLVARLGSNLTSPPRVGLDDSSRTSDAARLARDEAGGSGFTLKELDQVVAEVAGARHALLLGADGLPRGATSTIGKDLADTMSAAMTGIHAYSRAAADFAGGSQDAEWQQTVIEYQHGWIFLIAAGDDGFLAAAAEHDCDIEEFTTRLCDAVPAILAPEGWGEESDHV
ncbi:roadblock/LC7 domain-containing protein [Streptomyces sp. NPDC020707]|jgi:predicted regulator of Ras-like GTPase activity (Roadblock/LC7/MglB family)|uniref:Roadblock/LC7 domain-containing protein n=1 Tax=Streptomyces ortus TaxID=2867268 RepID=A0ABT3VCH8_9ACTN|nr:MULTISPECIES: roadblock/LC7 domain-containing protein [Streptomyces]MCX4237635.1 roadblock/LC7 domain-containing protein [Streptomyces ortus]